MADRGHRPLWISIICGLAAIGLIAIARPGEASPTGIVIYVLLGASLAFHAAYQVFAWRAWRMYRRGLKDQN